MLDIQKSMFEKALDQRKERERKSRKRNVYGNQKARQRLFHLSFNEANLKGLSYKADRRVEPMSPIYSTLNKCQKHI